MAASVSSQSLRPLCTSRAKRATSAPASVRWIFLPTCSKSGSPACASRLFTCIETAGCVRCSSSAAREKERWRATASKTLSWRSVMWRSGTAVSPAASAYGNDNVF